METYQIVCVGWASVFFGDEIIPKNLRWVKGAGRFASENGGSPWSDSVTPASVAGGDRGVRLSRGYRSISQNNAVEIGGVLLNHYKKRCGFFRL